MPTPIDPAFLPEVDQFDAQVPQLEDGWWPTGGSVDPATNSGIMNWQPQVLANRSRWLKNRIDPLLASTFQVAGLATGGGPINANPTITVPVASQAQAEAGVDNATAMTPLRVAQRVAAQTAGGLVPAGTVIMHAGGAAPTGYLKANGAAVSRTTFAALFAAIGTTYGAGDGATTFNVPDMRGMFARAWDDGRGVDTGRGLGTFQDSANLSHQHSGTTSVAGSHVHGSGASYPGGIFSQVGANNQNAHPIVTATGAAGDHSHTFTTDASGGTEARPKNIALLACIKF